MMRKHCQFITSVHLQVLVCMKLQCLLGLRENLPGSDDYVLSLVVNNIMWPRKVGCDYRNLPLDFFFVK